MSIATRLVVLLTLCSAIIMAVNFFLDYRLSRAEILNRLTIQSRDTIESAVTDLENLLDSVEGSTLFLARILQQRDYTLPGLQQMLRDLISENPDIYGATIALDPVRLDQPQGFAPYFYRTDGTLRHVDLAGENASYSRQPWYRDTVAAAKPLWVEPYFDKYGARVLMTTFAVPVYRVDDAGQRFLYAVVTADVPLQDLHNYLQRLQLGEHGYSILLSRAGTILSNRDPDLVMKHYRELSENREGDAILRSTFEAALAGETRTKELPCPHTGGACTLRMGALQSTGWPVGVLYAQSELLAPLRTYQLKTVLTGLATLLLMALAVTIVTRRLTRPLSALATASDEIARGKLATPLPEVPGEDEVARLVRSFRGMTEDLQSYIADLEAATASRSRLEGELTAAREIQMSMLPGRGNALEAGKGYALWARVLPAKSVGGDLYSYHRLGDTLHFVVGDVSDKGVPAALFMAKAMSHLQQLDSGRRPADVLARLNEALEPGNDSCMFVTLFLGLLDIQLGRLEFASAGHPPPQLLRAGASWPLEQETGPALGLARGLTYPTNTVQLRPADRLAVFTDGIDEAFNASGEMFSELRLRQQLELDSGRPVTEAGNRVFDAVAAYADGTAQSDDITLLLLDYKPDASTGGHRQQSFAPGDKLVTRTLQWLGRALQDLPVNTEFCGELMLVTEELVANIQDHAGLEEHDRIELSLQVDEAAVTLEVSDPGLPFNPLAEARRARLGADSGSAEVGGLGVHLISQLSDEQRYAYNAGRNRLRVIKYLRESAANNAGTTSELPDARRDSMELTTTVSADRENSVARVALDGALNTDTAPAFEQRLETVLAQGYQLTVLDMKNLDYISSAGLRVIFKAAKQAGAAGHRLAAANRKPHIDKVFEILKALPDMAVFADDKELDDYLDTMQMRVRDGE